MSSDKDDTASDDAGLFRQSLQGVTPLKDPGRVTPSHPLRPAIVRSPETAATPLDLPFTDHGAESASSEFLANGVSRMTLRKLRRGQQRIEDSLDLHGLTADEARRLLARFLEDSRLRGVRCVRIIHGKGRNPDGGDGRLKLLSRHWLAQSRGVLAYCEPPPAEGGGGAVVVLLSVITQPE